MPVRIGVDIGGTGIKAGVVDLDSGKLVSERVEAPTPAGAEPERIADTVAELLEALGGPAMGAVGICIPAVVRRGTARSAANISQRWLGLAVDRLFQQRLGRAVRVVNDADAAGFAEARFGAARGASGLVLVTTLGTGIGVGMVHDGVLIPNCELGHVEIDGEDWEARAAASALRRRGLSWEQWAADLQRYFQTLERLVHPDLFVVGGGIAGEHLQFLPLLKLETPIAPAWLGADAGISGAAASASVYLPAAAAPRARSAR